MTMLREHR